MCSKYSFFILGSLTFRAPLSHDFSGCAVGTLMGGLDFEEDTAMHRLMTPCVRRAVDERFLLMIYDADARSRLTVVIVLMLILSEADTDSFNNEGDGEVHATLWKIGDAAPVLQQVP